MSTSQKNILVIGGGGREHAIVLACAKSTQTRHLYCAPGSDAIAQQASCVSLALDDHPTVINWCKSSAIDLVIIGPEAPLVAGLADDLRAAGIPTFGPDKAAAMLEGSKTFSKQFMDRHGIPTAKWEYHQDFDTAKQALQHWESPPVIKADGLAAGKGVFVPETMAEAEDALAYILKDNAFGEAGASVLLEERLLGEEVSWIAVTDGTTILSFPPSQDHKRIYNNDEGPNTGGMGAYAPTTLVDDVLRETIQTNVCDAFVKGIKSDNLNYQGAIYFGLMIVDGQPYVLEFNVRFGDPECQILLGGLTSDFVDLTYYAAINSLEKATLSWQSGSAVIVVAASAGYPQSSSKGDVIYGLDNDIPQTAVLHAGTKRFEDTWQTNGGRVLGVVANKLYHSTSSICGLCTNGINTI